jgi:hypothetical protein
MWYKPTASIMGWFNLAAEWHPDWLKHLLGKWAWLRNYYNGDAKKYWEDSPQWGAPNVIVSWKMMDYTPASLKLCNVGSIPAAARIPGHGLDQIHMDAGGGQAGFYILLWRYKQTSCRI